MDRHGISKVQIVIAIILVIIVAVASGYVIFAGPSNNKLSSSSSQTTSPSSTTAGLPTTLTVDEPYSPDSFDPAGAFTIVGEEISSNTLLPLIFYNQTSSGQPDYNHFIPVIAKSWAESPNGMTYTFYLRNNVYFSNGDPLNAYGVWWNVYRGMIMNQIIDYVYTLYFNTTGVTANDLNTLNNPQNTPTDPNLMAVMQNPHNSVTVLNATTVEFHLTNPYVAFLPTVTTDPWFFVDPYTVEQHGGVVANQPNSYMSINGTMVGDGPYVTTKNVPNQYVVFSANPHYWAANMTSNYLLRPPHIQTIILNFQTNELNRALDLENNRAQLGTAVFGDIKTVLTTDKNLYVPPIGLSADTEFIFINTVKPPLDNLLARRAITAAINVTQIIQTVYEGYGAQYVGPLPKGLPFYNDTIKSPSFNVSEARSLLAEAGYPGGVGFPTITMVYTAGTHFTKVAEIMQNDLAQIGITLTSQGLTASTFVTYIAQPANATASPNLVADEWVFWPDFTAYEFLNSNIAGFFPYFNNQTITNLMLQSNVEIDQQLRAQEISRATSLTLQQAALIWLATDVDQYITAQGYGVVVFNKCVQGEWSNAAFNGVPYNSLNYVCPPS